MSGAILGLKFSTAFINLPRIQIECDVLGLDAADTHKIYRHVFVADGCSETLFDADLKFSSEGVFGNPSDTGATGCERMRLMVRRHRSKSLEIVNFRLDLEGCLACFVITVCASARVDLF